jgi:precorrin-2/cobalt-factor-2 C20-methyltransferase
MEKLKLKHPDLRIEIIPGISSVNAAAAASLMPLASHDERVAILSAERDDNFIRETLQQYDTVVFLKVNAIFDRLLNILTELRLAHQAAYVRNCSTSEQEIVRDILKLKGQKLDYFSILLVRKKPW